MLSYVLNLNMFKNNTGWFMNCKMKGASVFNHNVFLSLRYYHIQLCERWGTEWFLNVKFTPRHLGCPLRVNSTNFNCRATNQNRARTDFRSSATAGNNLSNNRINVNVISQTTCNINIHVSQDESSTADSFQQQQQQQRRNSRQNGSDSGTRDADGGGMGGGGGRIFSTMDSSSYPVIRTDTTVGARQHNNASNLSTNLTASRSLPAFGIPPPSFESVTSSQGADPALFRQSSISSHSHSPPPSFENSFLFDTLPSSVDGCGPPGFLDSVTTLPDYESLHHGPPPAYDSIFPS